MGRPRTYVTEEKRKRDEKTAFKTRKTTLDRGTYIVSMDE